MDLDFEGVVFTWRGPAPYYFVAVPEDEALEIREQRAALTYGWGVIPVTVLIGGTEFTTSLFPKGEGYLVPIKVSVRRAEGLDEGDLVSLRLTLTL